MKFATLMFALVGFLVLGLKPRGTSAAVATFGTETLFGYGYPTGSDPTLGATLSGLAPNSYTFANNGYGHSYPFTPSSGDLAGTDQIYVGQTQTGAYDEYALQTQRINGPDVITINYSSIVPQGQSITTLTLGIGADDFQYPRFGVPFTTTINGINDQALANAIMSDDMEIPNVNAGYEHFLSIGIDPAMLLPSNVLALSINEGGNGGDGWAVDFLTVGVTTPEPTGVAISGIIALVMCMGRSRRRAA